VREGRQIVIFPEGTRVEQGVEGGAAAGCGGAGGADGVGGDPGGDKFGALLGPPGFP